MKVLIIQHIICHVTIFSKEKKRGGNDFSFSETNWPWCGIYIYNNKISLGKNRLNAHNMVEIGVNDWSVIVGTHTSVTTLTERSSRLNHFVIEVHNYNYFSNRPWCWQNLKKYMMWIIVTEQQNCKKIHGLTITRRVRFNSILTILDQPKTLEKYFFTHQDDCCSSYWMIWCHEHDIRLCWLFKNM